MFDLILKLGLLLSPIVYGMNVSPDRFDTIFFWLFGVVLFSVSLFEQPKREIPLIVKRIILFLIGICLSNLFWYSFNPICLSVLINIFFGCFVFILIIKYASNSLTFYRYIFYAGLINIAVFLLQKINYNPIFDIKIEGEKGGLLGNGPRLMDYLAMTMPIAPFGFFYPLLSLLTKEFLIVGIAGLIFIRKANNKIRISLAFIILLISIFFLRQEIINSLHTRWLIWEPTIKIFLKRPLLGYGLGMFSRISSQFITKTGLQVDYAFNSYLQFIFGTGILGLVWLGYVFKYIYSKIKFDKTFFAVLSLCILCLLEYPFEIPKLWITIIAILAFFVIKKEESCL